MKALTEAQLSLVEESLRQGLAPVLPECEVEIKANDAAGGELRLFVVRAFGQQWSFNAEMSGPDAYSTGQAVARMVVAAGAKQRKAVANG